MTKEDILRLRDMAEQTRVQFKERVTRDNKYDVSCDVTRVHFIHCHTAEQQGYKTKNRNVTRN